MAFVFGTEAASSMLAAVALLTPATIQGLRKPVGQLSAALVGVSLLGGGWLPSSRWRVPRRELRGHPSLTSAMFGAVLGIPVATIVPSVGAYVILLAPLAQQGFGAACGIVIFGLFRVLPVVVRGWHVDDDGRLTPPYPYLIHSAVIVGLMAIADRSLVLGFALALIKN